MDRRRILMIMGGAWVSAALLTWFLWASTKAPKTERMIQVVAAARDMGAGTRLRQTDLKLVGVPEKDVPKAAILDPKLAVDRVLLFPVNTNEPVTVTKLTTTAGAEGLAATIEPGKRAIAVQINDASGVAGLVTPRSKVDVLFTKTGGSFGEALTSVLLEDVTVMSIGRMTEVQGAGGAVNPQAAQRATQTVATLLLTPDQAAKLELAKNHGKIGLALRNPLDRSTLSENNIVTGDMLDPLAWTRGTRKRPNMPPPQVLAKIKDPAEWAKLTAAEEPKPKPVEKKEPPKPRFIVDIFRGDKHIQESFQ